MNSDDLAWGTAVSIAAERELPKVVTEAESCAERLIQTSQQELKPLDRLGLRLTEEVSKRIELAPVLPLELIYQPPGLGDPHTQGKRD
jgi:hypothetical protein